jgi:glycogen phosphorylase/synthase
MTFFEVSFEVCNKVGGIYTVVSSKIPFLTQAVSAKGIEYICIGPYFQSSLSEFHEKPLTPLLQAVYTQLKSQGIVLHYGVWDIQGSPCCVLLDFSSFYYASDVFKEKLYSHFGVDSLRAGFDYTEPLTFSHAVGVFIQTYCAQQAQVYPQTDTSSTHLTHILHTHEWMCGFANLYCLIEKLPIKTVFTTHATILARASFGSGIDFASQVVSPESAQQLAQKLGVFEKYSVERACITRSHMCTTVSEITAHECLVEFGKKPVVIYNGIDCSSFGTFFNRLEKKITSRKIVQTIAQSICPELSSHARYIYCSGRFETHNKGFDVVIDALCELQKKMLAHSAQYSQQFKDTDTNPQQLVCFFFVPSQHTAIHPHILSNISHIQPLKCIQQLTTHDCQSNQLVDLCLARGLINSKLSPIKVVIVPSYVGSSDSLFCRSYYDVMSAFDVGVFPSMYEPFGYTPLESCACASYTLTTDYTGFGESVSRISSAQQTPLHSDITSTTQNATQGVTVLHRLAVSDDVFVQKLVAELETFFTLSDEELFERAIRAFLFAKNYDWSVLCPKYMSVYGL